MKRNFWYWVVAALCGTLTTLAVLATPAWWTNGVLSTNAADDYSAINLGQLKNMASAAHDELEDILPGGASFSLSFINDYNYDAANLGQLKAVAQPFYDRLIEVGYTTNVPWTLITDDDSDFSVANIGQLKNVFNFDVAIDSDGDGMPDWWEVLYGLNPTSGLNSELAGWWKLDEESGTNALNSATNAYHGELRAFAGTTNSGWVAGGKLGGALRFDGVDDWIRIAQSPAMVTGGAFTISAWAWLDSGYTSKWPAVVSDMYVSTNNDYTGFSMGFNSDSNAYGMVNDSLRADTNALVDQWVWVSLEYDGAQMRLYRNGEPVGGAWPTPFSSAVTNSLMIGDGHDSGFTEQWKGVIDDVRLYRTALGTNGVSSMYDACLDPDGDGLTNLDEFQWGTHPTLSNDVAAIWIHFPENGRRVP